MIINSFYQNAECDVYRMSDNIVASGVLERITDDYIAITSSENIPPIKPQTMLKVSLHSEGGHNLIIVGVVTDASERFIRLSNLQDFKEFNKREYFRLNVMINSRIQLKDEKGILTDTVVLVKIRDLSLKGIFFVAKDDSLNLGQQLEILLPISGAQTYSCTIRRKVDYYRSIGYGCSFDNLTNKQEDILCKFLFDQQRKEISRYKDKPY